MKRGASWRHI